MSSWQDIVAVRAVRTPMGRFGGTLREAPVYRLGAVAVRAALDVDDGCAAVPDEVILGCCRQAGNGPNPARSAALLAGVPARVPAATINMACPSGMKAIQLATASLLTGMSRLCVAGGMESMSTIPYLLKNARFEGFKMGDRRLEDGWSDSIDPICAMGMGQTAELLARSEKLSRVELDTFALDSHRKAVAAAELGRFAQEIIPIELNLPDSSSPTVLRADESPRSDTSLEKLAKLAPAFRTDGCITAGNSCGLSDGASAILLTTREEARTRGWSPLFSLVSYAEVAVEGQRMGIGPSAAIPIALRRAGLAIADIDLIEVNEAFAAQVLANERSIGWNRERLNVFGGAIALGHPTGNSGSRIVVTLANALRLLDRELGLASICGAGGVATALVIRREI